MLLRGAVTGVGGLLTATVVGLDVASVSADEPITTVAPTAVCLPILVGVVLVKFGFDLASRYRARLATVDEASYVDLGWVYEPPSTEPIEPVRAADSRRRVCRPGAPPSHTCTTPRRFSTCSTGVSPAYSRGEEDRRRVEPAG